MRILKQAILAGTVATASVFGFSSSASAAVELCYVGGGTQPQCANTSVNVLVNQQTGDPVFADDNDSNTNVTYSFTSSTEANLRQVASGQADVASADSDGALQQISFNILDGASASLITFNLVPLGNQVRLNLNTATAVPEPGTWAMMLLGFGVVGASMRRRRRIAGNLLQMA
jgi:hypothetical protein